MRMAFPLEALLTEFCSFRMPREKVIVTAAAGIGLIAATIYAVGLRPNQSQENSNMARRRSLDGAAGWKSTANRNDEQGLHETRGISKTGPETPSKRGPAHASEETK
ncbi:hypothetical protein J3458_008913 [Metarhizium acridum]|uniref:uncharacterized protein n=1 Tax=Metarhizium acridum TaxID=92637 RepID=UPI001C6C8BFB|nr:hypothetical protein J3458_008913 [Metarhizium acridum]